METSPLKSQLIEGAYCRAWGKLKSFHDRRHVNVQIIRPVEDMNEVSYHMLEATAVHLYYTRGPLDQAGKSGGAAPANGASHQTAAREQEAAAFGPTALQVYRYLQKQPQGDAGVHQQQIASDLGLNTVDVARAGDQLIEGGLMYTTLDELTWALLENE